MSWKLDRTTDRWVGHDHPGVVGSGFGDFVLDELELGGRVATLMDWTGEQTWWEMDNLGRREEPGRWGAVSQ